MNNEDDYYMVYILSEEGVEICKVQTMIEVYELLEKLDSSVSISIRKIKPLVKGRGYTKNIWGL